MGPLSLIRVPTVSSVLLRSALGLTLGSARQALASTGPGFVQVPVRAEQQNVKNMYRRADKPHETMLDNGRIFEMVNITVGGQPVSLILDTGSPELWVNPDCSTVGGAEQLVGDMDAADVALCQRGGRYDPTLSAPGAAVDLGQAFSATYGGGNTVAGGYYSDTVGIGGVAVAGQHFGVSNDSAGNVLGILGMSPDMLEGYNRSRPVDIVSSASYAQHPYSLLLDSMAEQGVINSRAFSLDLGDLDDAAGALILGGVDTGRFEGHLHTFPLINGYQDVMYDDGTAVPVPVYRYYVNVTSYSLTRPGADTAEPLHVAPSSGARHDPPFIDSGATLLYLPRGVMAQVCSSLDGILEQDSIACFVNCSVRGQAGGLGIHIANRQDASSAGDSTSFLIPYDNMVLAPSGPSISYCQVMIAEGGGGGGAPNLILGTPFLRSLYAVFDWDNQQVSLGKKANCGSNVVAIGKGTDSVPTTSGCSGSHKDIVPSAAAVSSNSQESSPSGTSSSPSPSVSANGFPRTSRPSWVFGSASGRVGWVMAAVVLLVGFM